MAYNDCYRQIELLEMRVETMLIERKFARSDGGSGAKPSELELWKRLFQKEYRDRTMIGIMIMVFQRVSSLSTYSSTAG